MEPGLAAGKRMVPQQNGTLAVRLSQFLSQPLHLLLRNHAAAVAFLRRIHYQKAVSAQLIAGRVAAGAFFPQIAPVKRLLEIVIAQHRNHRDSAALPFDQLPQITVVLLGSLMDQISGEHDHIRMGRHRLPDPGKNIVDRRHRLAQGRRSSMDPL